MLCDATMDNQLTSRVSDELRAQGLSVTGDQGKQGFWSVAFDIDGSKRAVILFLAESYFLIMAPIPPHPLLSLDEMGVDGLRKIVRLGSSIRLARLEYIDATPEVPQGTIVGLFAATSECSTDSFTGLKLRLRMEACAQLAGKIEKEFLSKSDSQREAER